MRVMCPLLSQKVTLLARNGSFGAGCMLPSVSKARDVILCSPAAGIPQLNVQNLHARPREFRLRATGPKSLAGIHGPSSITDLHGRDRGAPCSAKDDVPAATMYDLSRSRLEPEVPHGAECPKWLAARDAPRGWSRNPAP